MKSNYVFLFFLLVFSHLSMAQDALVINKEIQKIDNLIYYNQYDNAQKKIDSLYKQLTFTNREKYKSQILEVKFRKAVNLDIQDGSSVEVIQLLLGIINEVESENLHSLACRIYLLMALSYEKTENSDVKLLLTKKYLTKAYEVYENHELV